MGVVRRAHGVRGELRVHPVGAGAEVLGSVRTVTLRAPSGAAPGAGEQEYCVEQARQVSGGSVLLQLDGLGDRDGAAALAGYDVCVAEDVLPPLQAEEYYYFQLEGLEVVDLAGRSLGRVSGVFNAGASDVATVVRDEGEWMFPVVGDVVKEMDLDGGRIVVDPLPGLLEGGL